MYFPLYFQESGKSIPCIKKNKNLETQRWYAAAVKYHEQKKVGSDFIFTKQINRRKGKDVIIQTFAEEFQDVLLSYLLNWFAGNVTAFSFNDTNGEKLCFTEFSIRNYIKTEMEVWLLLTFSYVYTIS